MILKTKGNNDIRLKNAKKGKKNPNVKQPSHRDNPKGNFTTLYRCFWYLLYSYRSWDLRQYKLKHSENVTNKNLRRSYV